MKKLRICNLYCGIGGNRKLWGNKHEITAIENNPEIAKIYQDFFPNDKIIVTDAHQFLLEHFKEFDFIWSSPPCTSHSRTNHFLKATHNIIRYPDMRLYEEVILLQTHFKGKWIVENVISYYEPLIKPQKIGRHYFWSNFNIIKMSKMPKDDIGKMCGKNQKGHNIRKSIIREAQVPELSNLHGFDIEKIKLKNKRQILRNCVVPELGFHIFECAFKKPQLNLMNFEK